MGKTFRHTCAVLGLSTWLLLSGSTCSGSAIPPEAAYPSSSPTTALTALAIAGMDSLGSELSWATHSGTVPLQEEETQGGAALKLLFGAVLALAAGFLYWFSPAYDHLYEKLFGRVTDY